MHFELSTKKSVYRYTNDKHGNLRADDLGWHFHTDYELLYIIRGEGNFRIQQNMYRIQPNSLLVIKPGEYHGLFMESDKCYERIVIHFRDGDLSPDLQSSVSTLGNVYIIPGTRLSEEILRMNYYCTDFTGNIRNDIIDNQVQIILAYLCNIVGHYQAANYMDQGVERIIAYVQSNLVSIKTLDDICQNVHMSRSSVQKLISQQLQTPIMSYVRTQKCVLARSLLRKGHAATDVCIQSGFSDYSSFYRAYKSVFHEPPSASLSGTDRPGKL